MHHRVKFYYCNFLSVATGKMHHRKEEFNECQCTNLGIVIHSDGININDAIRLVKYWNLIAGKNYTYSIQFCK